jgi:glycosyltransferase involved in cell wall biosynthesis
VIIDSIEASRVEVSKPLVSVIMNCYNGEKYLRKAIDSVLQQTYRNLEIIFWDNQSTDSSAEIFKSYTDFRLKYFYSSSHTLLYKARNYALTKAQGEFISFLDADDWWEKDKLEKQIPLFNDSEVGLVYGNFWLLDERKKEAKKVGHRITLPEGRVLNHILNDYVIGLLTIVIRRQSIAKLDKHFDTRYQIIGDLDIVIRIATEWKLACIQEPVATYRYHGNNLSILEAERGLGELEVWYREMAVHPIIGIQSCFKSRLHNISYLKIINHLMQGQRFEAFILFIKYPLSFRKLRLLIAIVIPLSVLKAIRR